MTKAKRRMDMARAQEEVRQREKARGLKRKLVTIPVYREAELEAIVGEWMLEHPLNGDVAKS